MAPSALKWAVSYGVVLFTLVVGDALWLSYFARAVFRPTLGEILLNDPRWWAVGVFYPLYALGIAIFAVSPALRHGTMIGAVWRGALFGLIAYATYDLTNLATLKAWTIPLATMDVAWGSVLTAMAAYLGFVVAARG
jgi:uncharacterized membrane protein